MDADPLLAVGLFNLLSKPIIAWLNQERPPRQLPLSDFGRLRHEVKQCDVILVEGRSRVSNVIRLITQSTWTHAALYIGRLHDIEDEEVREIVMRHYGAAPEDQMVVESLLGRGTIVRSLSAYERDHLRICRPSGISHRDTQQVIRYAVSQLGYDYDVRHIIDLGRFLFPWIVLPRRWRSTLFTRRPGHSTRTVCSTMIGEAFSYVQFPILPLVKHSGIGGVQFFTRNPKLLTPSDFDYSPYFAIIKYPFLDFNYHANYRLLPWSGQVELLGEEREGYLGEADQPTEQEVDDAIARALRNGLVSREPDEGTNRDRGAESKEKP